MKSLLVALPLLLCGCLSDGPQQSRPAEFIEFGPTPRTPAVEPTSQAPAGATPPKVVTLYLGEQVTQVCDGRSCRLVPTDSGRCQMWWRAHNFKGDRFTIHIAESNPDWVTQPPTYHWNTKDGAKQISGISPEQFQSAFEQGEK